MMKDDLDKRLNDKKICSKADIVKETYDYIMDENPEENPDVKVEQNNELINPDPHSMGSRG